MSHTLTRDYLCMSSAWINAY